MAQHNRYYVSIFGWGQSVQIVVEAAGPNSALYRAVKEAGQGGMVVSDPRYRDLIMSQQGPTSDTYRGMCWTGSDNGNRAFVYEVRDRAPLGPQPRSENTVARYGVRADRSATARTVVARRAAAEAAGPERKPLPGRWAEVKVTTDGRQVGRTAPVTVERTLHPDAVAEIKRLSDALEEARRERNYAQVAASQAMAARDEYESRGIGLAGEVNDLQAAAEAYKDRIVRLFALLDERGVKVERLEAEVKRLKTENAGLHERNARQARMIREASAALGAG